MPPASLLTSLDDPADLARAVVVGEESLSRHRLREAATAYAGAALDLPAPGPVAVHATPSLGTVAAVVGCVLAGVPVVPVPPDAGPVERAHVLADSGAVAWAGEAPADVALPALRPRPRAGSLPAVDPDAVAVVLYTSGTTGAPKGVELSGRAIAAGLDALAEAWAWSPDDTLVHGLPLFHTHGLLLGVLGPLRLGARLHHTVRPSPAAYAATPGSLYFGVPTVWGRAVRDLASPGALASARLVVSGSAPLPVPVFEGLAALTGRAPVERYGMTETMITLSTRADGERRPGWVGVPVRGVETRLRGDDGAPVPDDGATIGRLEVRGPMLFRGYLGRPEATAASLTGDGWFVTGDLAVRDGSGQHRIVGRESTDLVKSGGYRIGTGEVEAVLLEHPDVEEVAVVGLPDPDLGQRLVAFVVGSASPGLGDALVELVATRLSRHKRPREVVFVDALPRNAMGKVQKSRLG